MKFNFACFLSHLRAEPVPTRTIPRSQLCNHTNQTHPIPARVQAAAEAGGSTFAPVSLAFLDLTYAVTAGRGKAKSEKSVIDNVSGYVQRGSFVAIMGPSGTEYPSLSVTFEK